MKERKIQKENKTIFTKVDPFRSALLLLGILGSMLLLLLLSLQSCPTLSDPIDSSPPGSAVLGIVLGASKSITRVHEASSRTFKQIHTKYILTLWNFCCL